MKLSSVSLRSTRYLKVHCRYYSKLYEIMPRFLYHSETIRNYLHASRHLTDIVTWYVCSCDNIQACFNICISGSRKCERGELTISLCFIVILIEFLHKMWTEVPKGKNKKPVNKDRFISKMFLRYLLITLPNLDFYLLTFCI